MLAVTDFFKSCFNERALPELSRRDQQRKNQGFQGNYFKMQHISEKKNDYFSLRTKKNGSDMKLRVVCLN